MTHPTPPAADNAIPTLTTSAGNPLADNHNALSAGPRGPLLMQDFQLMEKTAHFKRERVPDPPVRPDQGLATQGLPRDFSKADADDGRRVATGLRLAA